VGRTQGTIEDEPVQNYNY